MAQILNDFCKIIIIIINNKLFDTKINRNVRLAEAPDDGMPAIMYDVNCSGAKDYMDLALEIINGKK